MILLKATLKIIRIVLKLFFNLKILFHKPNTKKKRSDILIHKKMNFGRKKY